MIVSKGEDNMKNKLLMNLICLSFLCSCQGNSSKIDSTTKPSNEPSIEQPSTSTSNTPSNNPTEPQRIIFKKEYKIYINPSVQFKNQYYDKVHTEGQVMNEIALILVNRLKAETNLQIKANLDGLSLSNSVKESNAYHPDLHFAIHSNGGGGNGSEVWVSKKSYLFGKSILESLNQVHNFKNRGIKYGDGTDASLYEIKNVLASSALIEILFHDEINQANFILNNKQLIANSFFNGIVNYLTQLS